MQIFLSTDMDELIRKKMGPLLREARLSKNMTLNQFYGDIVAHVNNFSAIENGTRVIGKRLAKDIINFHHINIRWLEQGELPIFLSESSEPPSRYVKRTEQAVANKVPFYNIHWTDAKGADFLQEEPEFYVDFKPFNDCAAYLPVYGDSMRPRFSNGEIVAVKEIVNREVIQWGEAYLVITDEQANHMVTLKLLFEHTDPAKIILRAANPDFPGNTVVDKANIVKLFMVKGKITRNQI